MTEVPRGVLKQKLTSSGVGVLSPIALLRRVRLKPVEIERVVVLDLLLRWSGRALSIGLSVDWTAPATAIAIALLDSTVGWSLAGQAATVSSWIGLDVLQWSKILFKDHK